MKFSTPQKRYVVFEGLDGAGTTTQWNLLQSWMQQEGYPFMPVREPSPGPIGQLIRKFLSGSPPTDQGVLARLFAADRRQQIYEPGGVLENLKKDSWILSDRSLVSSLAYQSLVLPFKTILRLNEGIPLPGMIFFVDVSADVGMDRVLGRKDQLEIFEKRDVQQQVRKNYRRALKWIGRQGTNIVYLSGADSVESIHEIVKKTFKNYIDEHPMKIR